MNPGKYSRQNNRRELIENFSRIGIYWDMFLWLRISLHQFLKMPDCFRSKENVRAYVTYLCRDIIENNHV